jgi:hypothetical protein
VNRKQRRAFEAGKRAAKTGEAPPGYVELIKRMARLIPEWIAAEPGLPDLRWHDMVADEKTIIGPLKGDALKYVGGSPDAVRLLEWLDTQTNGEATLYQATWALKLAGQLPGGPERAAPETVHESAALKAIKAFADQTGTTTRYAAAPCPHCGTTIDAATGVGDAVPEPGNWAVCVACGGIVRYDAELRPVALDAEELAALEPEIRSHLEEMQALVRQSLARKLGGKRSPVDA